MSARHFGSKPGYLNTVTYLAPSSEVSTFLVTPYRYNGLPIPMPYSTTSHPRNTRPPTTLTSGRPGTARCPAGENETMFLSQLPYVPVGDLVPRCPTHIDQAISRTKHCVRQWNR